MTDTPSSKRDELTEQARNLVSEINKLNSDTGTKLEVVTKRQRRNTKVMVLVLLSFLADIIVTLVLGFTIHATAENTDKVDKITQRLDYQQDVTRKKVLCPLYQLFVDSRSEEGRKAYAKGPAEYDRVFNQIQDSYNAINCAEFKENTK